MTDTEVKMIKMERSRRMKEVTYEEWQKNPTREYKWKNSDCVYNNHDYLERKGI